MIEREDSRRDERLAAALAACIEAAEGGDRIDHQKLVDEYPEFARELTEYFAGRQQMDQLAAPLRDALGVQGTSHKRLGDFDILRELGRGGMGVVYEAEQISLKRRVALKILPFAGALDDKRLQRFKNEALAAAQLKHPHIVAVIHFGSDRGVHYYAMECVDGQSLAELIAGRPPRGDAPPRGPGTDGDGQTSPSGTLADTPVANKTTQPARRPADHYRQAAQLAIQAAEALQYAHESGIVHRDVKPANLLVDGRGHLWVADFGLALTRSDAELSLTGDVLGTVRYMSPEQAAGNRAILDERTDIYSLGITLYELTVGEPAFAGQDRHVILKRILEGEPPSPSSLDPHLPRDLETIILKATAHDPMDRYASMMEFAADLRSFLEARPIAARRQTPLQRASRWLARHHVAVALVASFALILFAVQGFALWRQATLREQAEMQYLRAEKARRSEAKSREEADAQRLRAEQGERETWNVTQRLLGPVFDDWNTLRKSYVLQRRALDIAVEEHRRRLEDSPSPTRTSQVNFARLLLMRTDSSWMLGRDMKEDCEAAIALLEPLAAEEATTGADASRLLSEALRTRANYRTLEARFLEAAQGEATLLTRVFSLDHSGLPREAVEQGLAYLDRVRERGKRTGYFFATYEACEELAHPLVHMGRVDQAAALVREAIQLTADPTETNSVRLYWHARALMTGAMVAIASGDPQLGLERGRRGVVVYQQVDPPQTGVVWITRKLAQCHRYIGDALVGLHRLEEAEAAYLRAIEVRSPFESNSDRLRIAQAKFQLAQVYASMGQMDASKVQLEHALRTCEDLVGILPQEPVTVSKLVMILTLSPDPALRDVDKALELAVRLPNTSGHLCRLKALANLRAGRFAEAIEMAEQAMTLLEGGDSIDRFLLAIAHGQYGQADQAREFADEAIAMLGEGHPHLFYDLGPLAAQQLKREAERLLEHDPSADP